MNCLQKKAKHINRNIIFLAGLSLMYRCTLVQYKNKSILAQTYKHAFFINRKGIY